MVFNSFILKGLLKVSLCLTTVLLLSSCSTITPSRELATEVAGEENGNYEYNSKQEVSNRPAFTQKRFKSSDMY